MSKTLLDQLREMSVVVADTGDSFAIGCFKPRDATTNPSLIALAAQMPEYQALVDDTLARASAELGPAAAPARVAALACEWLTVGIGLKILSIIPGRVSTEVDARLSYDTKATVAKGRQLIAQFEAAGIHRRRILIKIAATWEGIRAAEILEREGIHCNLTLLFGMHQAVAAAEAGATLISPFVGRILDWYKQETGRVDYSPQEDPGVVSVTGIYNYYKKFGYRTEIMAASFRNSGEVIELAGCDLLTLSVPLLAELQHTEGVLTRKLEPAAAASLPIERLAIDRNTFERLHQADRVAHDKLAEGIRGFAAAIEAQERALLERLHYLDARCSRAVA
jgi:transaldolase